MVISHVICPSPTTFKYFHHHHSTFPFHTNQAVSIRYLINAEGFGKSERNKKAAYIYKHNKSLSLRGAGAICGVRYISIINHFNKETKSAADNYIFYQKFTPIEENILKQYVEISRRFHGIL
jgi:hypothetical protein